jgi:hypothetical protein
MTRRIASLILIAVALSACDASIVNPGIQGTKQLEAPSEQEADGSLFMKWLTRPPSGVNGVKGT